jgi:hypothetical protein
VGGREETSRYVPASVPLQKVSILVDAAAHCSLELTFQLPLPLRVQVVAVRRAIRKQREQELAAEPSSSSSVRGPAGSIRRGSGAARADDHASVSGAEGSTEQPKTIPSRRNTVMVFTLPPHLGSYSFNEPGRRLLLLRNIKQIDVWRQSDYATVVLALFTDIGFLANKVEDGVFELLHRPVSRARIVAAPAPAVYGPRAIKVCWSVWRYLFVCLFVVGCH